MSTISKYHVALIGKALGDPTRLAIYTQIAKCCGELFPSEMEANRAISPATLSHHLKILSDLGLITSRRAGRYVYYKVNPEKLSNYLTYLSKFPHETQASSPAQSQHI